MNRTRLLISVVCLQLISCFVVASDLQQSIPLWPDKPPQFMENAPAESVADNGAIHNVTVPSITLFPAPPEKRNGTAIIICSGGGYGALGWKMCVEYAAPVFNSMGVTVIGLKYRLRPPHKLNNSGIQALTSAH